MKWPGFRQSPVVSKVIRVQTEDFDPGSELEQLRLQNNGRAGAIVSFTGLVRDLNDGENITHMTLEHYPGMTEKVLADLEREAQTRWELTATLIIHRVGPLLPDDRIVFVAAASAHRQQAFRACEYLIDTLKTSAPFWKKETTAGGERWVK
ncbi:MAG: molybdenum cofactor biosynthesis protein MoaE [Gammaproteobacteria bacterium]